MNKYIKFGITSGIIVINCFTHPLALDHEVNIDIITKYTSASNINDTEKKL